MSKTKQAFLAILTDRPVAYHPLFAKLCGGVTAGVLLSQLFYWIDKQKDPDGWIYKTQAEFTEETGLTRYEQEHARKQLRGLGVLREKKKGIPAKLHYEIDLEALTSLLDSSIQGWGNPAYKDGILQQTNAESTTETTSESKGSSTEVPEPSSQPSISEHKKVMDWYQEELGYTIPNGGMEGKAVKWMLKEGFTPEKIQGCYRYLKSDSYWQDKHLSLTKVKTEIGAWSLNPKEKTLVRSRASQETAQPVDDLAKYREQKGEQDRKRAEFERDPEEYRRKYYGIGTPAK